MAAPSQAQVPPRELGPTVPVPTPSMQALGRERYRIGSIIVDRKTQRLTVSGRLLGADRPLEYFAVAKGGYKSYESLVELDATGSEFNLACILLGLDASKSKRSEFQFSKDPLSGQRVGVEVAWKVGNKRVTTTPLKMLLTDQQRQPRRLGLHRFDDDRTRPHFRRRQLRFDHRFRARPDVDHRAHDRTRDWRLWFGGR
jgi:hypothetical protein